MGGMVSRQFAQKEAKETKGKTGFGCWDSHGFQGGSLETVFRNAMKDQLATERVFLK
jgi:hypothetical protein